MGNSNKKYDKKTGIAGIIVALLVAAVYFFSGGFGKGQDVKDNVQTPAAYESTAPGQRESIAYSFRTEELLLNHYEKHGIEMGFASAEEYEAAANRVISHPDVLYKLEAEDNDHVYYLEETNEFVVVSTDGYIRTYFLPDRGIDYFNAQ